LASDQVDPAGLREAGVHLKAGSLTPLDTLLRDAEAVSGTAIELACGARAQVHSEEDVIIPLEDLLKEILEPNGFVTYRDPASERVIVTRDLSRRIYPLSKPLYRRLTQAADHWLGDPDMDFEEALCKAALGDSSWQGVTIQVEDTVYALDTSRRELLVIDSRVHQEQIRKRLSTLSGQQEEDSVQALSAEASFQRQRPNREEAAGEGRMIYPEPEDGSISVVDTPEHLERIDEYLRPSHSPSRWRSSDGLTRFIRVQHRSPLELMLLLR
jgi:hypothetical protein